MSWCPTCTGTLVQIERYGTIEYVEVNFVSLKKSGTGTVKLERKNYCYGTVLVY